MIRNHKSPLPLAAYANICIVSFTQGEILKGSSFRCAIFFFTIYFLHNAQFFVMGAPCTLVYNYGFPSF